MDIRLLCRKEVECLWNKIIIFLIVVDIYNVDGVDLYRLRFFWVF